MVGCQVVLVVAERKSWGIVFSSWWLLPYVLALTLLFTLVAGLSLSWLLLLRIVVPVLWSLSSSFGKWTLAIDIRWVRKSSSCSLIIRGLVKFVRKTSFVNSVVSWTWLLLLLPLKIVLLIINHLFRMRRYISSSERPIINVLGRRFNKISLLSLSLQLLWASVSLLSLLINNLWLVFLVEYLWLHSCSEMTTIWVTWSLVFTSADHLILLVLPAVLNSLFFLKHSSIIVNLALDSWLNANKFSRHSMFAWISLVVNSCKLVIKTLLGVRSCILAWTLERLCMHVRVSGLTSTSASLLGWSTGNSDCTSTSRILGHSATTSSLLLLLLNNWFLFIVQHVLISQSIFLSFKLLLNEHVWSRLILLRPNFGSLNSFLCLSLFAYLTLCCLRSLLLMNYLCFRKVSVTRHVPLSVSVKLVLTWRTSIRHRDVLLTRFEVTNRWVFRNCLATCISKASSTATCSAHSCVCLFECSLSRLCCKDGTLWGKHALLYVLVLVWNDAAIDWFFNNCNIITWWALLNLDWISLLLDLSYSCIKTILSISLHIFVDFCLVWIWSELLVG